MRDVPDLPAGAEAGFEIGQCLMQEYGIAGGTVDKAIDILRGEAW